MCLYRFQFQATSGIPGTRGIHMYDSCSCMPEVSPKNSYMRPISSAGAADFGEKHHGPCAFHIIPWNGSGHVRYMSLNYKSCNVGIVISLMRHVCFLSAYQSGCDWWLELIGACKACQSFSNPIKTCGFGAHVSGKAYRRTIPIDK